MFPLKFCLFFRVSRPPPSPPDLSENPDFDLSHAFSNKLGPAGRHSELWASARRLKFPSGSVEGELASFCFPASGGGGGRSDHYQIPWSMEGCKPSVGISGLWVSAKPGMRRQGGRNFHVSTGRTLVLTIRPPGPACVRLYGFQPPICCKV